jgi:hypothetical protein
MIVKTLSAFACCLLFANFASAQLSATLKLSKKQYLAGETITHFRQQRPHAVA